MMVDTFDPEVRGWIMSRVLSRNTKPEQIVCGALRECHIRFSTNGKGLPGNPDIIMRRIRLAVFVNGCFWHWHGCKRSRMPASNVAYWERKISRNVARDRRTKRALSLAGWHYCTIWECNTPRGIARLRAMIRRLNSGKTQG
jgi:DNA mismatch endonuclease (patch repair protein)